jgi:hypothetical protein
LAVTNSTPSAPVPARANDDSPYLRDNLLAFESLLQSTTQISDKTAAPHLTQGDLETLLEGIGSASELTHHYKTDSNCQQVSILFLLLLK